MDKEGICEKAMIYFTSDMHFGHRNIINLCQRPFSSAEEMDNCMIQNWNNTIKNNDEVYILGDIAWGDTDDYLKQLNGKKYLVKGNHDKIQSSEYLRWIKDYHEFKYNGVRIILCHYPIEEWNGYFRGSVHLHGHQHNHIPVTADRRIDVGVDAWNFCPVSIERLIR